MNQTAAGHDNGRDHHNAQQNAARGGAHDFFPTAISERSIGSRRSATPVAA